MKYRFLVGLAFLLAAAGIIWASNHWRPEPVVIVKGYLGGSKANLMDDRDVQEVLRVKYHLAVQFTTLGGLEQPKPEMDLSDFIWPATELTVEQYKLQHGGTATYDSLLLSPIVMYTWEPVAEALNQAGFVGKRADGVYYADMEKFVPALIDHKIILPGGQAGSDAIVVYTSDPTKSNSGQIFAAMLAKTLQKVNGERFDETFPVIKAYFDSLGFKPPKTADLFMQCLGKGIGACPIFVGYESLLPDFARDHNVECKDLSLLKAIYPVPTMWATHPMIAATPAGKELLKAMRDSEIQNIAVKMHGFRSVLGKTEPNNCILTAASVDTMPLPTNAEMDSLTKQLEQQ
jgi:hypothetical protein